MTSAEFIGQLSSWVWGPYMLALILGVGLLLTIRIRAISIRKIPYAFRQLFAGREAMGEGSIAPFSALMLSLSATIGTGNIAGVATAIGIGGPGALFWMWITALIGMATKYGEAVCAVHFREKTPRGLHVGGPMYYIRNGLGSNWKWLAGMFALFGTFAGFGIGNAVQVNSVAEAMDESFGLDQKITAAVLMVLVGLVLLGGVKRLASVARKIVPMMAVTYVVAGGLILFVKIADVPAALLLVVKSAFTPVSVQGGFVGATVAMAIQMGVARGVFSNEAGLGSAPIAHASAATDNPVRQGMVAMLGTFIDTLVICSITGLAIIVTGVWTGEAQAAKMTQAAFDNALPFGHYIVSVSLVFFAFTTILGWSFYSERCAEYLSNNRIIIPFRVAWVLAIPLGILPSIHPGWDLQMLWLIADVMNGMMAVPNLIALLLLSGLVAKLTRQYYIGRQT